MYFLVIIMSLLVNLSIAEVAKVSKIIGPGDGYIIRNQEKISLALDMNLEEGDEIFSENSVLVVHLYPESQLSISKKTQITLTKNLIEGDKEKEKSFSIINFVKGIIRLQVVKEENLEVDQQVMAKGVSFAVRGTEFEVSSEGEDFDLDVLEGEVEVSSPFVHTFVPEMVKANEGFRFNQKAKKYQRRKLAMKFKDHPGFAQKDEIRQKWKVKRSELKTKRKEKRVLRKERREEKKIGRSERMNNRRERSRK